MNTAIQVLDLLDHFMTAEDLDALDDKTLHRLEGMLYYWHEVAERRVEACIARAAVSREEESE